MYERAYERDEEGCFLEPSERVRQALIDAMRTCCPSRQGPEGIVVPDPDVTPTPDVRPMPDVRPTPDTVPTPPLPPPPTTTTGGGDRRAYGEDTLAPARLGSRSTPRPRP
jgi:hypothetical protein